MSQPGQDQRWLPRGPEKWKPVSTGKSDLLDIFPSGTQGGHDRQDSVTVRAGRPETWRVRVVFHGANRSLHRSPPGTQLPFDVHTVLVEAGQPSRSLKSGLPKVQFTISMKNSVLAGLTYPLMSELGAMSYIVVPGKADQGVAVWEPEQAVTRRGQM